MPDQIPPDPGVLLVLDAMRADAESLADRCHKASGSLNGYVLGYAAAAARHLESAARNLATAHQWAKSELRAADERKEVANDAG